MNRAASMIGALAHVLVVSLLLLLVLVAASPVKAAETLTGSFTQAATHDCRTSTVTYEIVLTIPQEMQDTIAAEMGSSTYATIVSDLPVGLKWLSASLSGDAYLAGSTANIVSRTRDSDRVIAERVLLAPGDVDDDGRAATIVVRGVAEVQAGMPVPSTFSHAVMLTVEGRRFGAFTPYAEDLESTPPGGGTGTITKTGTPTEVTADPDACMPDPADPGRPERGEACLSAQAVVYCGEEDGEYTVIVTGETASPDFVVINVLTPGVAIDVGGSPEVSVAVPVVAGTYYAELVVTGAAPGTAMTLAIEGDGDVGVVEDLPDGFALCCATELVVVIPPDCEERPEPEPEPEPVWDLKIEKIFDDEEPCEGGRACQFRLKVTNEGPDPHGGDVAIRDSNEGKPFVFAPFTAPAPWSCTGDESTLECTYPDADLPVGGFVEIPVRVVSLLRVAGPVEIENCGEIVQPADSKDTNALNDRGCAVSPVPEPPVTETPPEDAPAPPDDDPAPPDDVITPDDDDTPEPPAPVDLSITKTAPSSCRGREECAFTVTVRNAGESTYEGTLVVSDVPGANGVTYAGHSPSDWTCTRAARGVVCARSDTVLAPGESLSLTIRFNVPDSSSLRRTGLENCAYLGGEPAGPVGGADVRAVQRALRDFGYDPGPVDGAFGPRTAQGLRDFQRNNGLSVTGTITPETIERLGLSGPEELSEPYSDAFADDNAYCVRTNIAVPPPPACGPGEQLRNGRCVSICPRGQEFRNGRCRARVIQCPQGQEFRSGRCRDIRCPAGQELRNGRCLAIRCPAGQEFRNGRCRPIRDTAPQCPQGQVFRDGRCRDVVQRCPQGQILRGDRCVPVLRSCEPGEVLVNGRCVKLQIRIPNFGTIEIE